MLDEEKTQATDQELVKRSIRDPRFFTSIIKRYEQPLLRYIRRLTSINHEEAEDILQEVFIKTYYNLNDFDPELKFSSWIYRITHHQVISHYRKQKARPHGNQMVIDDEFLKNFASDFDMTKAVDQKLLREQLEIILDHLDLKNL